MSCCDEYCANYGCNQGRDCPIRGAKVARVRSRKHDRDPLPPSVTHVYLRHLAKWLLIALVVMTATPIVLTAAFAKPAPPASTCEALLAKYKATPAHITIKCNRP